MTETLATPVLPVVRVAILAGGRMAEMALPAELPLREILPAVQRLLRSGSDAAENVDAAETTRLSLAPIGGAPFSLDATLDTVGVVDGDLLALQPIPVGPAAPGIVEDIADAAVIFAESRRQPWGALHVQRIARAAVITLVLIGTGLAAAQRLATGSAVGLYVLSALAILTVLVALLLRSRAPQTGVELSVAALAPIAAAFTLAVPGDFGAAQVLLGAAGVVAWALINMIVGKEALTVFTAVAVVGFGVLVAAGAAVLWQLPLSDATLPGCILLLIALLVTIQAPQLAAVWARFPLPVIPAPGDPSPTAPSLRVLQDLPRRVRIGDAHQTGFIAGAVLLSVVGSLAVVGLPAPPSVWAWYLVAATSVAAVLRARVWDSAACKTWLLVQPFLLLTALIVVFTAQGRLVAALWAVAVLAVLVGVWVFVAGTPRLADPDTYSLPMRRLVGFLATAADASLIPVMAYLVGLFALVLDR